MDVLHDDRILLFDVLEHPDDAAVFHLVEKSEFLDELIEGSRIRRVPELLDRNQSAAPGLPTASRDLASTEVHGTEMPGTEFLQDLVAADVP